VIAMPTVRLEISATPSHVRTARLVATAAARRCGVDPGVLDEIRLAVGEACTRAVGLHRQYCQQESVVLLLSDDVDFTVTVRDAAPVGFEPGPLDVIELLEQSNEQPEENFDTLPDAFGLTVIAGLVEDLKITPRDDGPGTQVVMSWPVRFRNPPAKPA
jgi:anti-sigma regulatory factor (Ser/Thr protein kinase)